MKKFLSLSLIVISFICTACNSQSEQEKAIKEYLSENLYDADFEIIEMGELKEFSRLDAFLDDYQRYDKNKVIPMDKAINEFIAQSKANGQDIHEVLAYYIKVEYKAKNRFGVSSKHKAKFLFDLDKEYIVSVLDDE